MALGIRGGACSSTRSLIVEGTSRPVGFTALTEVGGGAAGVDFATAARGTGVSGAFAGGGAGRVAVGAAGAAGAAAGAVVAGAVVAAGTTGAAASAGVIRGAAGAAGTGGLSAGTAGAAASAGAVGVSGAAGSTTTGAGAGAGAMASAGRLAAGVAGATVAADAAAGRVSAVSETPGCSRASGGGVGAGGGVTRFTSRGGPSLGGWAGSGALAPLRLGEADDEENRRPPGRFRLRSRAIRLANSRATISSMVLDALLTSMPCARSRRSITSWLGIPSTSATL